MTSFTFCGQMFMSLVRDAETAQALGGMWVTFSVLFAGILIRPDAIPKFWTFAYWIVPGHYLFEALFTTQFGNSDTVITASPGSPFFLSLGCDSSTGITTPCQGTVAEFMKVSFPNFDRGHVYYCGIYFGVLIIISRVVAKWALTSFDYRST